MQTFKLKLIVKSVKAQTQKRSSLGARLKQTCILKFFLCRWKCTSKFLYQNAEFWFKAIKISIDESIYLEFKYQNCYK